MDKSMTPWNRALSLSPSNMHAPFAQHFVSLSLALVNTTLAMTSGRLPALNSKTTAVQKNKTAWSGAFFPGQE